MSNAPWIGVGIEGEWSDPGLALAASGLDFRVMKQKAYTEDGRILPNTAVNIRESDNAILGVVADKYGLVQNTDAFAMLEPYLSTGGKITHVGMTQQGMVFMLAEIDAMNILGDNYTLYALGMNSFNARYGCSVLLTCHRIVCQNMFANLIPQAKKMGTYFFHKSKAEEKVVRAASVSKSIHVFENAFEDKLKLLAASPLTDTIVNKFLDLVFPMRLDESAPRFAAYKENNEETRAMFLKEYYETPDNANFVGTNLGLINAYYDYLSHRPELKTDSKRKWEDARFTGLVSGTSVNTHALNLLM